MITHETQVRVRYKETDAMGVVHHSNYVNYYELARTEMLRSMGMTYRDMEESGVMMPVLEVDMRFFIPGRYDDLLTVKTIVKKLPTAKIEFEHEIRNQKGELVNTGRVVLVFMNSETRRACRAPQQFLELFENHFSQSATT